jgi:leucyl aminopeptidase
MAWPVILAGSSHEFFSEITMLVSTTSTAAIPLLLLGEDRFDAFLAQQPARSQTWSKLQGFRSERNKLLLIPDEHGTAAAVWLGIGKSRLEEVLNLWLAAGLPERLPEGTYQMPEGLTSLQAAQFALGWLYGQYRFERYKKSSERKQRQLAVGTQVDLIQVQQLAAACALARDLINTPACDLTPTVLAQTAVDMAKTHGAVVRRYAGDELLRANFPAVHAVGRAAAIAPELVDFEWGNASHPRVTLVGKGVCFDSGGLDIKPPSGMLLMKKDMGGAACTLALAQLIMQAQLPVRLRVIIAAVENAIAGNAFRPGDVLNTRAGLSVEVGNTDAEGRLILCDALALADADAPELLIDMATLTGAARVALGPELPALFTRDTQLADDLMAVGLRECDPVWHLPLWAGYDDELSSKIADLNNVSSTGFSGAIIGGLFLQRFVSKAKQWVHLDLYAWNAKDRPGRPAGAEAQCVRLLFGYLQKRFG